MIKHFVLGMACLAVLSGCDSGDPSPQPQKDPPRKSVTSCEDGSGTSWEGPATDLFEELQQNMVDHWQIFSSENPGDFVTPPVSVSDVKLVEAAGHVPRLCATFTELGMGTLPKPTTVKWLASATSYCEESLDGTWQSALRVLAGRIGNGGIYVTAQVEEDVLILDSVANTATPGKALPGDAVLIAGKFMTGFRLVTDPGKPAQVCMDLSN